MVVKEANVDRQTSTNIVGIVGIVGAGLIGCSWAHVFARAGWQVRVWDPSAAQRESALARITRSLKDLQAHGLVDDADAAAARVQVVDTLHAAVQGAQYVQESGPETLEAKRATFAALDAAAPEGCVLASSTSAIVASQFTADLAGRARCLVAHPVNPPHLVPVVELCGAPWTCARHARTRPRRDAAAWARCRSTSNARSTASCSTACSARC